MKMFELQTPSEPELVFQARMLWREFLFSRITREGLSCSKVDLLRPHGTISDSTVVLLKLADELENLRPHVYRNISKQLGISVSVDVVVSDAFLSVASEILSLGITWGKVVAIFSVAGGLAVDCVRQGCPAVVQTIEESLAEFVKKSLVPWLKRRGGWVDVLQCVRQSESPPSPHWISSVLLTCKHLLKTIYVHLMK